MVVTLMVKSDDTAVKATAQRVLDYFGSSLPRSRLLCFLDDDDPLTLKGEFGAANRGFYGPIHDSTRLADLPDYITSCIFVDDGVSIPFPRIVDDFIYLYGSTCTDAVGLTMTLAHELQHAIQHANVRKLWAANSLINRLDRKVIDIVKLQWADIPTEREARIVSKRVAVRFFGEQRVTEFIDRKIGERIDDSDVADWQFIRRLTASSTVDLAGDTDLLFRQLKGHRRELEEALHRARADNPEDFADIDLDVFLR